MADTIQFDLVSPERSLASLEVKAVQIPGADGDLTAMPDHAPLITTLRPGILTVEAPGETSEYVVFGGFAEIGASGISVLAEKAVPKGEMTRADLDAMVEEARAAVETAKASDDNLVDDAVKLLADMEALGTHMSL
ncbi:F0F1 ATP synthase subunit epsilon [Aestuariivita boseongensis]|uniref:F0F1 ATP synthase subunit epsilon n=1 Tax=Aestuariivita boseongensis TaxID=1470562 RepID=UPI000681C304|nr:F0F1 ATP synthase subunit epsilon [Aestuariivita boseongensis]